MPFPNNAIGYFIGPGVNGGNGGDSSLKFEGL